MLYNVEICRYEFKFSLLRYLGLVTQLSWQKKRKMQLQMEKTSLFFYFAYEIILLISLYCPLKVFVESQASFNLPWSLSVFLVN